MSMREWRCRRCGKLLGAVESGRLHVRLARGHEYIVSLPAATVCRGCRALNELRSQPLSSPSSGTLARSA